MKSLLLLIPSTFLLILSSIAATPGAVKNNDCESYSPLLVEPLASTSNESPGNNPILHFLDLSHGMERDSCGNFYDAQLDTIQGLLHKEFTSLWYLPEDSVQFKMTLGLYVDESFPSDIVRTIVFQKVNQVIPEAFSYDVTDQTQEIILKEGVNPSLSTEDFINRWHTLFDKVSSMNAGDPHLASYQEIPASRGCTVCHRIYEDSTWATYIVENSVDFHSSSGSTSKADYYTINKSTGKLFTLEDALEKAELSAIKSDIRKEYEKAALSKGFEANDYSPDKLISERDGIALLDNAVLIYFHPYKIGCGAEDQYNLILPLPGNN